MFSTQINRPTLARGGARLRLQHAGPHPITLSVRWKENSVTSSPNPWAKYKSLQSEYYRLRDDERYAEARNVLDRMVELIESDRSAFSEPEDRIRVLRAQKVMTEYQEERFSAPSDKLAALLMAAAEMNIPSLCDNQPCARLRPEDCVERKSILSPRRAKMCIERITYVCEALKIEAASEEGRSENPDWELALSKRRDAAALHKSVLRLAASERREAHQRYLEYWQFVVEGQVALLNGQFNSAKEWFCKALEVAPLLDPKQCFGNVFRDVDEVRAHQVYVDAVRCVQAGRFGEASKLFQAWLNLFSERVPKNAQYKRYNDIRVYALACDILSRFPLGTVEPEDWDSISTFVADADVSLPTWVLVERLEELHGRWSLWRRQAGDPSDLQPEINRFSDEWLLFVPSSPLRGEDKSAGRVRPVNIPSFLNIFDKLEKDAHNWKELLAQNLKNLFLLMADYESKRHLNPPDDEKDRQKLTNPPLASEGMTTAELGQVILLYLRRRAEKHAANFESALQNIAAMQAAMSTDNFLGAVATQKRIFETIRFWPHTVKVLEQRDLASYELGEEHSEFLRKETKAQRLWDRYPREVVLQGPQDLKKDRFYYLRPRWNIWFEERKRIRHEQFHPSELPGWITVFFGNIFGKPKIDPKRFHDWILQFEDSERLLACRLFDALEYYDEEKMRSVLAEGFKNLPPKARDADYYIGMGHGAKSGRLIPFLLRQGVSTLPEHEIPFAGKEKTVFRDIAEIEIARLRLRKAKTIVFLDDFIGKGGQAKDFLNWYFKNYAWVYDASIYLWVLTGFRSAIQEVQKEFSETVEGVFAGKVLEEGDRAFSPENPIWASEKECGAAERWAKEIGCQLLTGNPARDPETGGPLYKPERDAVGWHGCQALVAFAHNIPSDTLPIFWATGMRKTKTWGNPLLERHD